MDRSRRRFAGLRLATLVFLVFSLLPWVRSVQATTIDIMLVYDTTATSWVASNGGMAAFSQDVVNRLNQAMQNSGVDITFRLVHSMSVAYTTQSSTKTPLSADLNALQAGTGPFAAVATARNTYGADLVAMLVDHGSAYGYVGLSYMLNDWSGHADYAYSVNAIRAVAIDHTLTHEVGHNLGAHHSKYQASDPGPNRDLDNQYSAGWYFTGTNGVKYHTIMAYEDDGYGGHYIEAPLFSTPLKTYQGVAAGHARDGDNARLLRQTKDVIAAYRAGGSTKPTIPSAPVALAATNVTSTGFTANWSSVANAKGYWLELSQSSAFTTKLYDGAVGNITSQAVSKLSPSTTYYYRVRAYNDAGQSANSNVISVTTSSQGGQSRYSRQVYVMYAGYFGRPPAPAGFDYYSNWMDRTKGNYRILIDDFYRSSESQALYGPLNTRDQIKQVFQFLFARDPLPQGLNYWAGLVDSGRISVAEMAYTIAYNASSNDQAVLNAKVAAAQAFNEELRRVQQTKTCAMDSDYGRSFLANVKDQSDADVMVSLIEWTIFFMCP
ncbi:MAG: M12 family metallo-peptidase [Thermochromatium sp.]